ncbi:hypothetical protein C8N40_11081 [Pontibacter mucosus]|uniref:Spy/CpxP family protein refolding chaperone n=1 Tax=Pontibacter mucosus TaxID=1649266 RepID=A0A2T5YDM2_9BACT|nr:hypothetical protein [Pontibacter mucosus]PTX14653.1 hypothetical protein C8N40_11081 [Pontibacter mucosus]
MKKTTKTYAKVMLAAALGFSFAAEAANYTFAEANAAVVTIQDDKLPMQQELLGEHADINAITAANMRQAYITFMENVREQKANWGDTEWQNAKNVLERLNAHKETVEKELGTDDKGKIKMLQAEFRTLETGGDIKD